MNDLAIYILVWILAFMSGWVIRDRTIKRSRYSGYIYVLKDEDGTYLSLNVKSINDITDHDEVTLGVITQK